MEKSNVKYDAYIRILEEELVPAMGCTEPIAIAYGTAKGREVLEHFGEYLPRFKKIIPHDYERVLKTIVQMEEKGLSAEQAQIEAFYANTRK